MRHTPNTAVIGIDIQPCFMPLTEGMRLHRNGFGEIPVPRGNEVVPVGNRLFAVAGKLGYEAITSQDWHPEETDHFARPGTKPDYKTNWPIHGVAGTPGAELHPELVLPGRHLRIIKGMEHLKAGQFDTSYSIYYGEDPTTGHSLPRWIKDHRVGKAAVFGLAYEACVKKSALDLKRELGLEVTVITDASQALTAEGEAQTRRELEAAGIELTTADQWIRQQLAAVEGAR